VAGWLVAFGVFSRIIFIFQDKGVFDAPSSHPNYNKKMDKQFPMHPASIML
jgi:hypothetical protein